MPLYAFVDPSVQELMLGNTPPDDVAHWWEVPFGTNVNDLYINKKGEVATVPPKPGYWAVFDAIQEKWVDPRTDAEKADELNAHRRNTVISKSDLLIKLVERGVLSATDAESAAGGEMPSVFQDMLSTLPEDVATVARIKWKSETLIARTNPVVVAAAYLLEIEDETLDEIFDVPQP